MNRTDFNTWLSLEKKQSLIMGILNITPDSFSDGGEFIDPKRAVEHALDMIQDGADVIDIGGESTRPGAEPVPLGLELERVIPVIEGIRKESDDLISIDTYKARVAEEALCAGASMVNDISGLTFDKKMAGLVAETEIPLIIMHIKGKPKDMQINSRYDDLLSEILEFFEKQTSRAIEAGIRSENIILDPGIGFGKQLDDNFEIIRELKQISAMNFPVLLGPSRKSFIGSVLNLPPEDRVEGTAAAVTAGILNGAKILRVHDVKVMKRVAEISDKIKGDI